MNSIRLRSRLRTSSYRPYLGPGLLTALVFFLALVSPVSYEVGDSQLSLLVSQAILDHGTIALDAYEGMAGISTDNYRLLHTDGHIYYYFPLGSSVLSVPFVWAANRLGKDMVVVQDDRWTQNLISALVCAAVFIVLYQICRCYLDRTASLVVSTISVLGSSLISTLGTALWSLDYAVLFVSLALWMIVRYEVGKSETVHPFVLGALLFLAYASRPTTAVFIALALLYLIFRNRRWFVLTAGTSLILLLVYQVTSAAAYGQNLFVYYSPRRFQVHRNPLEVALVGHFFSPSRGILVFSPFLALVFAGAVAGFGKLRRNPMYWMIGLWFGFSVLVVSRSTRWWGGWSYGPRILTDAMPGLVLLTVLVWHNVAAGKSERLRRIMVIGYLSLGAVAILLNSYQGLFNVHTFRWNGSIPPDVDRLPKLVFDWRYPQFAATRALLCRRNAEHMSELLALGSFELEKYLPGDQITAVSGAHQISDFPWYGVQANSETGSDVPAKNVDQLTARLWLPVANNDIAHPNALFVGWSYVESDYRWSECESALIALELSEDRPATAKSRLQFTSGSFGQQSVIVMLNGSPIGDMSFAGPESPPVEREILFDSALLEPQTVNVLEFRFPNAAVPATGDARKLGLAFTALRIVPAD